MRIFAGSLLITIATAALGQNIAGTYESALAAAESQRAAHRWEEAASGYRAAAGAALQLRQTARAQYRLAQMYEEMGDRDAALLWYRQSMLRYRHSDTSAAIRRLAPDASRIMPAAQISRALKVDEGHARGISVSVDVPVNFAFDSDRLTPDGEKQVAEMAEALFGAALEGERFALVGHTDKVGTDEYNQSLSWRRAQSVRDALRDRYGFDAVRLDVMGRGKRDLLSESDSEAEQAINRRVEIRRLGR